MAVISLKPHAVLFPATLLFLAGATHAASATEFARFPAEPELRGTPHAPILDTKKKRQFRTVLREAAQESANFNGHYRIARWGCGSNCIEWAVIDLQSGRVQMRGTVLSCSGALAGPRESDPPPSDWFESHATSRLLYLHSCADPGNHLIFDTREVFQLRKGRLELLRTETLGPRGSSPSDHPHGD